MFLNAANAMPDGGTLTITTATDGKNSVLITFKDTGCGISSENVDKIFDPFLPRCPRARERDSGCQLPTVLSNIMQALSLWKALWGKGLPLRSNCR